MLNYGVVAILAFVGGILFWLCFARLDRDEEKWNMIQEGRYKGRKGSVTVVEDNAVEQGVMDTLSKGESMEKI